MISRLHRVLWLALALGTTGGFFALAQTSPVPPPSAAAPSPAPVVMVKSPVELFRQLLAMKPDARNKFLADRPAEKRQGLLDKIKEYEAMKPDERELSLCATELQSYLEPLLATAATNRAAQLASVPEPYRKIVGERLSEWDILPPDLQKDMLAHEATKRYFLGAGSDGFTEESSRILPPSLDEEVVRLGQMSPAERKQSFAAAQQFFGLNDEERQKVIETLSGADRQKVGQTLQILRQLPKEQLDRCLKSIGQLADLSERERQAFIKDAQRWKKMSAAEREAWQNLTDRLPPLPPGLEVPTPDDVWKIMPPGMSPKAVNLTN